MTDFPAIWGLIGGLSLFVAFLAGVFLGERMAQQDHLDSLRRIRDALDGKAGLTD